MKDAQQTTDYLIDEFNEHSLYDIATSILYYLEKGGIVYGKHILKRILK